MISANPASCSWKIWMAPSCAICSTPFTNCLRFIESNWMTLAKCSGANVGIPSYSKSSFGRQTVSPIEKIPGSNTPMISPAYASSTILRSCAIICCGWESLIFFLLCTCFTSMFASNLPEQILINAILSRWFLFIFA